MYRVATPVQPAAIEGYSSANALVAYELAYHLLYAFYQPKLLFQLATNVIVTNELGGRYQNKPQVGLVRTPPSTLRSELTSLPEGKFSQRLTGEAGVDRATEPDRKKLLLLKNREYLGGGPNGLLDIRHGGGTGRLNFTE